MSSHQGDIVRVPVRNTFFIAGYGPFQCSHQGDHKEIAGYGAGYGPLQCSHQGDHHEIVGYILVQLTAHVSLSGLPVLTSL